MSESSSLVFSDPEEYQATFRPAYVGIVVTATGRFRAELTRAKLHHLEVIRGWQSLPRIARSGHIKEQRSISFLIGDRQSPSIVNGVEAHSDQIGFNAPGVEVYQRTSTECCWGALSLPAEAFDMAARALVGRELTVPVQMQLLRPPPHLMSRLLHLHNAVTELVTTVPDVLARPEVAKALEQELVPAMLLCLTNQTVRDGGGIRGYHQRMPIMRKFEQAVSERPNEPLYVAEICAAIGVQERTLRNHCLYHVGMSPHRYLWLRRMNQARRALSLADAATTTVTAIAFGHGFWELGRFSGAYRRLFDEPPLATLRRPPDHQPIDLTSSR
jgi:AraC-like DNA-binding protein